MRIMLALTLVVAAVGARAEDVAYPVADKSMEEAVEDVAASMVTLDLDLAKRMALERNPSLQAAAERMEQARQQVRQAVSTFFPQIALTFSATETTLSDTAYDAARSAAFQNRFRGLQSQFESALFGNGLPSTSVLAQQGFQATLLGLYDAAAVDDTTEQYNAQIVATWVLFNGFQREFSARAARYGAKQSEAAYEEAQRLLLDAVALSFFNAQLSRERIRIAQADEEFNQRQLSEAQVRRRVGTGSLSDELNFEVRLNAAKGATIAADKQYRVAIAGLAALLGCDAGCLPQHLSIAELPDESPDELSLPDVDAAISRALEQRPDISRQRYALDQTDATVKARRGAFLPSVTALASRNATRASDANFETDDFGTTVGLTVSYDLFRGGADRAELARAKAAKREAEQLLRYAEIQATAEVRQAWELLRAALESLDLERQNEGYVERNRDLVEKEYRAGQASLVRLNQAQRDLIEARVNLAIARVSVRQAWHDLHTATADTLVPAGEEPDAGGSAQSVQ